jgi:hypothetical protein
MGPKLLRRSVSLLAVALCIYSCESGSIFKPRPRVRLWVYEPGIPEKESSLLQVRSLSRDLKHCSGRKDKYLLSDEDIEGLSVRNEVEIYAKLKEDTPGCSGIIENLSIKVELAYEFENSKRQIHEALIDGQLDTSLN